MPDLTPAQQRAVRLALELARAQHRIRELEAQKAAVLRFVEGYPSSPLTEQIRLVYTAEIITEET